MDPDARTPSRDRRGTARSRGGSRGEGPRRRVAAGASSSSHGFCQRRARHDGGLRSAHREVGTDPVGSVRRDGAQRSSGSSSAVDRRRAVRRRVLRCERWRGRTRRPVHHAPYRGHPLPLPARRATHAQRPLNARVASDNLSILNLSILGEQVLPGERLDPGIALRVLDSVLRIPVGSTAPGWRGNSAWIARRSAATWAFSNAGS